MRWEVVVLLGGLWGLLYRTLATHWSVSREYSYGWVVPLLTGYLVVARWKWRPQPNGPERAGYWMAGVGTLAFLPTWLLLQPNPDWRVLDWIFAGEIVLITMGIIALVGGWAWVRHFAFPCSFVFTAVPCPRPWEIPLIDGLTRIVTEVSVGALNLTGVPALSQGNIIEVRTGLLGVEEACSGIQSLQATLMIAFFFGEVFRLSVARRAFLCIFGIFVAIATNIGRTYFLACDASHLGIDSMEHLHDSAANIALLACFALVWVAALLLEKRRQEAEAVTVVSSIPAVPIGFVRVLLTWTVLVICATEIWFRSAPGERPLRWSIVPARNSKIVEIPKWTLEQLQADATTAAAWEDEDGYRWHLYFFRWDAGPIRSRLLARLHRPESCLPSIGMTLSQRRGQVTVQTEQFPLTFHSYRFEEKGSPLFVYWGVWDDRTTDSKRIGTLPNAFASAAFQNVLDRQRNLGQQVVELAVSGCDDARAADIALERVVPTLVISDER
jgi:exosortase